MSLIWAGISCFFANLRQTAQGRAEAGAFIGREFFEGVLDPGDGPFERLALGGHRNELGVRVSPASIGRGKVESELPCIIQAIKLNQQAQEPLDEHIGVGVSLERIGRGLCGGFELSVRIEAGDPGHFRLDLLAAPLVL